MDAEFQVESVAVPLIMPLLQGLLWSNWGVNRILLTPLPVFFPIAKAHHIICSPRQSSTSICGNDACQSAQQLKAYCLCTDCWSSFYPFSRSYRSCFLLHLYATLPYTKLQPELSNPPASNASLSDFQVLSVYQRARIILASQRHFCVLLFSDLHHSRFLFSLHSKVKCLN